MLIASSLLLSYIEIEKLPALKNTLRAGITDLIILIVILLFSNDKNDISAFDVYDWVKYFNYDILLLNDSNTQIEIINYSIVLNKVLLEFRIAGKVIEFNRVKSYYWRRGDIRHCFSADWEINKTYDPLHWFLEDEKNIFSDSIMYYLETKNKIGNFTENRNDNKLINLNVASQIGLQVPDTIITTRKNELLKFLTKNKRVVSKAISNGFQIELGNHFFCQYTEEVDYEGLIECPDTFFPTLFQQKLEKKYELRVFYLKGEFYPMAIFSQRDFQTQVDFRKYNWSKPNRMVPYQLPGELEKKLERFMQQVRLDTGSIDLIYTNAEEYVFLEVNPVGQFGMVSETCNYHIEKKIAELLIN